MNNKFIVPIGILTAIILIIAGVYTIVTPQKAMINEELTNNTEEYDESSSSSAHMPKLTVEAGKLEKNAKPSFEVGKKYTYQATSQTIMERDYCTSGGCITKNETVTRMIPSEFVVEKMERVEGKECYVVSQARKIKISEEEKAARHMIEEVVKSMEEHMNSWRGYYYYDKETGKCIQAEYSALDGTTVLKKERAEYAALESILFSEWMLALKDDFAWEQKSNTSDQNLDAETKGVSEYVVKGREKVNGRECFKVEITTKSEASYFGGKQKNEFNGITIMWIDVKERIMVKSTTKEGGVITSETELINEQ